MSSRSSLISPKNIFIGLLSIIVVVGFHFHNQLRQENSKSLWTITQLRDRIDGLDDNIKAVIETRSQCLTSMKAAKTELLSVRKTLTEANSQVQKENEQLKRQVSEFEVKFNNLQDDYKKSQDTGSNSVKELQKLLNDKDESLKLLKTEKDSESAKFKDEIANLQRENAELTEKLTKGGIALPKKVEPAVVKEKDQQVQAPGKPNPYPDVKQEQQQQQQQQQQPAAAAKEEEKKVNNAEESENAGEKKVEENAEKAQIVPNKAAEGEKEAVVNIQQIPPAEKKAVESGGNEAENKEVKPLNNEN